jgi:hypothetical protein
VNQIRKPDGSLFEEVLPLEVLYVIDNQHVPAQKKSPDVMDAIRQVQQICHYRYNGSVLRFKKIIFGFFQLFLNLLIKHPLFF